MNGKDLLFSYGEIKENGGLKTIKQLDTDVFNEAVEKPAFFEELKAEIKFSVGADSILLECKINGILKLECSRCGEFFKYRFEENFDETYADSVEYIDVLNLLYQALVMAVPMKSLCAENCRGRCPVCKKNLNTGQCDCRMEPDSPFKILKEQTDAKSQKKTYSVQKRF
ncbi:MAG: DUF177 domain-containing protein [Elusimicrobia bacterium]|nr:DUF177 domain-containing protein [Elusimicrobiota bacterium]